MTAVFKKVLSRIRRYLPAVVLSLLLAAVYVVMSLYIPILVGKAIDCIIAAGKVDFAAMSPILLQVLLCAGIAGLSQWIMNMLNNRITYSVTRDMRSDAFQRIQVLPLSYLDSKANGDLLSRVISDVDTFADGLLMGFTQLFTGVMTIVGTLILMLTIRWQIALVVILVTPLSLLVAAYVSKSTFSMFQMQTKTRGEQTALIDEAVSGIKVVQAFGHENATMEQFDEVNERLERFSLRAIFFSSLTNPSTRFINALAYAAICLTGALIAVGGSLSVGTLTCFLSYANQYTKPFNEISGVIAELQNAMACAGRVLELIEAPAQEPDPEIPAVLNGADGNVEISNLAFSYTPEKELIRDFNLQVAAGQHIAIVGPTGCGKTTLINLLMRFYDPKEGSIRLDETDISHVTRQELRSNIGMVLQDTWLKAGTIRDNIAMGHEDATEEEIVDAARRAHAHSFIRRLPRGYDTVITESGDGLSQGQKQLLCIARVMLSLPPMLILDEATSSIDTRTELKIQKAFDAMMQGRTSFIVAHRLSTIREADVILVMQNGHIVEQGKHDALLQKGGFYAQLYNSQFTH